VTYRADLFGGSHRRHDGHSRVVRVGARAMNPRASTAPRRAGHGPQCASRSIFQHGITAPREEGDSMKEPARRDHRPCSRGIANPASAYVFEITTSIPTASVLDTAQLRDALRSAIDDVLRHAIAFTPTIVTLQSARVVGDRSTSCC